MTSDRAPSSGPVAIVGAGSWGTALAIHLGRRGAVARLWARDADLAREIVRRGENPRYLPGVAIPARVAATGDAAIALRGAPIVVFAVPSQYARATLGPLLAHLDEDAVIVSATKGMEPERGLRMSELLAELAPSHPVSVLSGPSFAREVALGRPAALVAASRRLEVARSTQRALAGPTLRIYTNADVLGVELAGALKNVIAIAAGLSDSLALGENARAALVTRGLAEMARLGVALGASARTFAGLAGLGDLVLTATGSLSRNRALGLAVGQGQSLREAEAATPMVAEGVRTVSAALRLAREAGVPMPICAAVAAVLFEGVPVADALAGLLAREPRPEEEVDVSRA
jgi:glycerol-3-phosphate dehydrogenase (NAD(P)+)